MSDAIKRSVRKQQAGKGRPLNMTPNTAHFLDIILTPSDLDHTASLAEFIRNEVLREISNKIKTCDQRGSY